MVLFEKTSNFYAVFPQNFESICRHMVKKFCGEKGDFIKYMELVLLIAASFEACIRSVGGLKKIKL